MSEPTLRDAPAQPVRASPGKLRQVRARDLAVRFGFGAATSLVAGLIGIVFGSRAGGLFLAFPAILAASLTLISSEEDRQAAREDSRGAIVGGVAMAAFAVAGAALFTQLVAGAVLVVTSVAWLAVALGGYAALWLRRRR